MKTAKDAYNRTTNSDMETTAAEFWEYYPEPRDSTHFLNLDENGGIDLKKVFEFAEEYATQEQGEGEWIKVDDRLPSKGDVVMVYREAGTIPGSFYIDTGAYGFYVDEVWGDRENDNWNVTYWMPLPEPPVQQLNEKG